MTPSESRLRSQIAAHESWAQTPDRTARTSNARAAMDAKFLMQAEGDEARAASLRKAHYARLALKSAQARRKSRELTETAEAAEAELDQMSGDAHDAA